MTRVLLVDDHPVVRTGLQMLLSAAGIEVVAEGANGEEGADGGRGRSGGSMSGAPTHAGREERESLGEGRGERSDRPIFIEGQGKGRGTREGRWQAGH